MIVPVGVYEHLLHHDLFIETPCVLVKIYRDGVPIHTYGFHALEREDIEDGVLFRVMYLSGHSFFDADIMTRYTAHISLPGQPGLVGEFDETARTFKFYHENN